MKKLLIINIVLLVFSCASSKNIIKESLVKNPTFYIFSNSKQEAKKAVIEALDGLKSSHRSSFYEYLLVEYFNGDIKLLPNHGNPSKVYFRKNGEAYLYCTRMEIVIDSITENTTKVSINAVKPEVRIGKTLLPIIPHMQRIWKYKSVPATTVEEYDILLMIGKELNEENMPELKIPEKVVF